MNSRVMQWLVLSRDSLQGFNGAHRAKLVRPNEPASLFPHIQDSKVPDLRSGRPHGHREAPLLTTNSIRVAQATPRCKHCGSTFCPAFRSVRNSQKNNNFKRLDSTSAGCGKLRILWETAAVPGDHMCRGISPKSVIPFTKYCIASATSSKPIMRTRIRMPVSPRNRRTRAAAASTR